MKILIIGDSWLKGAYDLPGLHHPSHPGLQFFLQQLGHDVDNLSVRGGSNSLSIALAQEFIVKWKQPDIVIAGVANWMRETRDFFNNQDYFQAVYNTHSRNTKPFDALINELEVSWNEDSIEKIVEPLYLKYYEQLKNLNVPVVILGGNHTFAPCLDFPGIKQSLTEFCCESFTDSYFTTKVDLDAFVKTFLKKTTHDKSTKYRLTEDMIKGFDKKYNDWYNNTVCKPYINMEHGTVAMHKKIFDNLVEQGLV